MNVLVIGKGGREHAIAWKMAQSPQVDRVFAAPGSDGMKTIAECAALSETDTAGLIQFAKDNDIRLTFVGPEAPLVAGIVDEFRKAGLTIFGPTQAAAEIEGSKAFAKDLMKKYSIPTAAFETFETQEDALRYLETAPIPIVVKADGLAAGKGVTVAETRGEARDAVRAMMEDEQFGTAGSRIVIEEFLGGEEFSLMALVNGRDVWPLALSQDHKRAFEGDKGPNTGGMGAYSPVPQLPAGTLDAAMQTILKPTAAAMAEVGRTFTGILYAGLILTDEGPKVIEFNCRFGDPETQVILPRLDSDFAEAILDVLDGREPALKWSDDACAGVVLASDGYPAGYDKGFDLADPEALDEETLLFHSGTRLDEASGRWQGNGGRLLLVARKAAKLEDALRAATAEAEKLDSPDVFFRRDIGHKALKK